MILTFWGYYFLSQFLFNRFNKARSFQVPHGVHTLLAGNHSTTWYKVAAGSSPSLTHTHTRQDFFWQSLQKTVNISAVHEREWITVFLWKISVCLDTHISLVLTVAGPWLSAGGPYLQDICCTWHLSLLQGHELHANSIEAFNTQGFGPHPTGALSQVFSRWDKSLPLRPQTRAQTLGVGATSSG